MMRFLPLVIFAVLALALAFALTVPKSGRPSALIGKPMPDFNLPELGKKHGYVTPVRMKGEVAVVNFFASWCAPCRAEQETLADLLRMGGVAIYGISYKDKAEDTKAFLAEADNPFAAVGMDADGKQAMNWGVTGVPETFVIDRDGIIRYRLQGPLDAKELNGRLLPLLKELERK